MNDATTTEATTTPQIHETTPSEDITTLVEAIMADRKAAYLRWLNAKNWLEYRGEHVNCYGGENEADIVYDDVDYVDIEEFFDSVNVLRADEEAVTRAVSREWEAWIEAGAPHD